MKIGLIVLGAQKCATTSLFRLLSAHPRFVASRVKETDFFSSARDWRRELGRYHALFAEEGEGVRVEASPSYTFFPHRNLRIWDDLYEYNPELKLVYLVRDPADRLVSAYRHSLARGYTRASLERFVLEDPLALDVTRYYTQIAPFVERFGREHVLIMRFVDVARTPATALRRVGELVGVDMGDVDSVTPVHANASVADPERAPLPLGGPLGRALRRRLMPWRRKLAGRFRASSGRTAFTPEFHAALLRLLDREIGALEALMERDLSAWRAIGRDRAVTPMVSAA